MNQTMMTILTQRELFLIGLFVVTYAVLFVVTAQNSRRKILLLEERLHKVDAMRQQQQAQSAQSIAQNVQKIAELEQLLAQMGDENSMLRLELEQKKENLQYNNKVAVIDNEKRSQAETTIFQSDIYRRMQRYLDEGRMMSQDDWAQLVQLIDGIYTGFTEKLYGLYKLSQQDYYVSLLIKARMQPKEIATLTAHSKESVASTRSRLYQKVFGKKGSSRQWDDFILSL